MSLIALCCGKGSPGCTLISVNLAFSLIGIKQDTLLMDVDAAGGDLAAYLGLDPRRGLYPLVRSEGSAVSPESLIREAEDRRGISCIGGFHGPDEADVDAIADALEAALDTGKTVVADFGRISADTAPMLDAANLVLVAVRPDLVGVYGANRAIDCLQKAGVREGCIAAVISGWQRSRPADLAETAQALKVKVLGTIPLDRRRVRKAIAAQKPLRRGPAAKGMDSLAREVARTLNRSSSSRAVPAP